MLKKVKEIRVYIIDCNRTDFDFREAEHKGDYDSIIDEAESLGTVYSLEYFQECINNEELDLSNSFILIR
jgi:hypothetical protein